MDLTSAAFWAALGSIIWVNILLSGDNAVVIAMAARSLPERQQKKAILFGSAAAIFLRIALTVIALEMLKWPYLKLVGALLLLYIGISLLAEGEEGESDVGGGGNASLFNAVRTILVADLVMSLDNVLAVAAAAKGNVPLLVFGLAVSIPLIIFGSTLLLKVMERFPIIITTGAGLLGWLAGEMFLTDPAVVQRFGESGPLVLNTTRIFGAALVVAVGTWLRRRHRATAAGADGE
jgi:YjbE family integral membrane protein